MTECDQIQKVVWADGPEAAGAVHVDTCPVCSAEVRKAADLRAALSGMQNRLAPTPAGLESSLLEVAVRTSVQRARDFVSQPQFLRGAAIGAAAAAAAGAVLGVAVARRRGVLAGTAA